MFITFEANDGAGKTTQIGLLHQALLDAGYDAIRTREPGGSTGAEQIRNLILQGDADKWSAHTEILLFNAARRDHLEKVIWPALSAGKIVLCDRYIGSTLALQVAGGASREMILDLHRIACDNFMPAETVFLKMDPIAALKRSNARLAEQASSESRFESKGEEYHRRVAIEMETQAELYGWLKIDAAQSIEDVHRQILSKVLPLL